MGSRLPARRRQGALLGAGVQDHGRPVRGPVDFYPRVLWPAEDRRFGAERSHYEDRAHWAPAQDARNKREEISEILAGDICAAVGLKNVGTGDTICDEDHPIALDPSLLRFP